MGGFDEKLCPWEEGRSVHGARFVHLASSKFGFAYITILSWRRPFHFLHTRRHVNNATEHRGNGVINTWTRCPDSRSYLTNIQNPPIHIQRLLSKQIHFRPDRFALPNFAAFIPASNSPICYSACDSISRPCCGDIHTRAVQ